jgi:hypothetical protein
MAHLALLVYIVQIVAIDHWHPNPADASGVPNSNAHILHCHGASSGCADGGAFLAPTVASHALTPLPPAPRLQQVVPSFALPSDVVVATPHQPPRAA